MEVGVGLRGVSLDQDTRFSDKDRKLLRTTKFPPEFDKKVDMRKVELEVMKPWIAKTVNTLLGFEDEVVIEYVAGLLEDEKSPIIDPKKMQVSLTGFLESKTPEFMTELWRLLLSAQASPLKVPPEFIEQKKLEMRARQEKEEKAVARRQDEANRDQQTEVIRQRERRERREQQADDLRRRPRDSGWDVRAQLNGRAEDARTQRDPPRERPRKRFESPPRDRRSARRSVSPDHRFERNTSRERAQYTSPPSRSSPRLDSHVSPSPPPRRRRRSSTPPRDRYSPSPEPRYRRRDSRSPSPRRRRRRRSYSRSRSRSPPARRRYAPGDRSRSPPRRRHRSLTPEYESRRRSPAPRQRDPSLTPEESLRGSRTDDAEYSSSRHESLEDKEAMLRAQVLRRKVEASRNDY